MKKTTEYIKEAWLIYTQKENFIFFARIMSVLVISTTSIGYLISYLFPENDWYNPGFVILAVLSITLNLWSKSTKNMAILKIGMPENKVFKIGFNKLGKYLLVSLVFGLLTLIGLIFLVVPGILFGVWYAFSVFLVLDKDMSIKEALKISKKMVSDKFWGVLGRFIVFSLFGLLTSVFITIIPQVGVMLISFVAPLFTLPFYLLYKDLLNFD